MNISTILGKKIEQTQAFLEDGTRVPLTRVFIGSNSISQIKTVEKEGYNSVQVAFGTKQRISKPLSGHLTKAGIKSTPRFLREIRVGDASGFEAGAVIAPEDVLNPGDKIDVVGVSKGKGFAGAVKRWHFKGGPKTHGQSDRHRAPGSIGQGTTPGRVYKGKKMAGRMGTDRVTIKNLQIMEVKDGEVLIKGLVPGPKGSMVMITKIGTKKNFMPLLSSIEEVVEETVEAPVTEEIVVEPKVDVKVEESQAVEEDTKTEEAPVVESGGNVEKLQDEVKEDTKEPTDAKAIEGKEKTESK